MERRKAIKLCCYSAISIPTIGFGLQSCAGIYYASPSRNEKRLTVSLSEFTYVKKEKIVDRNFVLLDVDELNFPICLHKQSNDTYIASLLRCTHRSCELNVGGGIYSCPCHGSEFSIAGKVLEGPAIEDLVTFKTETDHENIYVYLS